MWSSVGTLLAVTAILGPLVSAHPTGVPQSACESMSPGGRGHGHAAAQTTPLPYDVAVRPGSPTVELTITQRADGPTFKGFMAQARAAGSTVPLGTFNEEEGQVKTILCTNAGDTASHTNREEKSTVTLTWNPPAEYSGKVFFFLTIVEEATTFWVHEEVGSITLG